MRSEIGQLTLDHVLKERAALNTNITAAINDAAEAWGVTCLRYEIRDIHAPGAVVEATMITAGFSRASWPSARATAASSSTTASE